ncbi:hypothetical protein L6452_02805 [Arctium lappa]|uniref:Uncharacterized protein n=1 Tax=Arctium lappa TaxID=4217 RepID=A0ACB9FJY3_ARCLA|nr:hypothetical protein L6452_02805 [Arctium lappa]
MIFLCFRNKGSSDTNCWIPDLISEHLQNVIRASDIVFRASDEAISSSHLNIQRECLQSSDVVFRASDEAISDVFSEC